MSKDNASALIFVVVLFGIGWLRSLFGENEPVDSTTILILGRQEIRETLKDPDSLQIIKEKTLSPGKNGATWGYEATYRAKNSFGGYVQENFYHEWN